MRGLAAAELDTDATLIRVAAQEDRAPFPPLFPRGRLATGEAHAIGPADTFDLDDVGAQGAQHLRGDRACPEGGEIGHPDFRPAEGRPVARVAARRAAASARVRCPRPHRGGEPGARVAIAVASVGHARLGHSARGFDEDATLDEVVDLHHRIGCADGRHGDSQCHGEVDDLVGGAGFRPVAGPSPGTRRGDAHVRASTPDRRRRGGPAGRSAPGSPETVAR